MAALLLVDGATSASASFTAAGTARTNARVASIEPATQVTLERVGADVTVSWGTATMTRAASVQGYVVRRSDGAGICGDPTPVTGRSCTDAGVPDGVYAYTVTAVYNTFTALATSRSLPIGAGPVPAPAFDPTSDSPPSIGFGFPGQLAGIAGADPEPIGAVSHADPAVSDVPSAAATTADTLPTAGEPEPAPAPVNSADSANPARKHPADVGHSHGRRPTAHPTTNDADAAAPDPDTAAPDPDTATPDPDTPTPDPDDTTTTARSPQAAVVEPAITAHPGNRTGRRPPSFSFTSASGTGDECKLDDGRFTACVSPISYAGLVAGVHTFQVRATDGSSAGPAISYSWTILGPAPSTDDTPAHAGAPAAAPDTPTPTATTPAPLPAPAGSADTDVEPDTATVTTGNDDPAVQDAPAAASPPATQALR